MEGDFTHTVPENIGYGISIHALRVEGDSAAFGTAWRCTERFLSTPSGWRATIYNASTVTRKEFLSTPSGWRATVDRMPVVFIYRFLSTPSGWRATPKSRCSSSLRRDFYPRPPGGGRLVDANNAQLEFTISIHALRVEGDNAVRVYTVSVTKFLSTPSGWRATIERRILFDRKQNFYPRPPGGGRLGHEGRVGRRRTISIHALRVEGDAKAAARRRTVAISIHALRVEGDDHRLRGGKASNDFYPRPPGGGRPPRRMLIPLTAGFLSTPSGWRATAVEITPRWRALYFYPRPPGGGRPAEQAASSASAAISIHALRVEGDTQPTQAQLRARAISIHALRVEGDTQKQPMKSITLRFLSTPSGWRATCAIPWRDIRLAYFYPRPPGGGRL